MTANEHEDLNWLAFDSAEVRALLDHALACSEHRPTPDQMLESRYLRDGAPKPAKGVLPPLEHVAVERIPPGLHLVVGDGLYMTSNGLPDGDVDLVYAPGCNPAADGDWRGTVEALAGVEKQFLLLPADAVGDVLTEAGDQVWLGLRRDEDRFGVEEYGLAASPE